MYILRGAFFNELHFDDKSWAPNFNFRSPNHACRVKKGVVISPRHSTKPVIIPQLDNLALEGRLPVISSRNLYLFIIMGSILRRVPAKTLAIIGKSANYSVPTHAMDFLEVYFRRCQ